jgi:1-acyl-sn-glycerol-3-phosphate acyltransferase
VGRFCFGLYFYVVFSVCALLALMLIALLPGQANRRKVAQGAAAGVFRLSGSWPEISGSEHLPEQPSVVVANHASYLDGVLMTAVLPHRYQFVVKREVTRLPLVHFFLRRLGTHFVERFDPHQGAADARKLLNTASQGASLAFFPEGTFGNEVGLRKFHNGAFAIASRNDLPLVPIAIRGTRDMLSADRRLPRPGKLAVIILPPLNSGAPITDALAALQQSRAQILAKLDEPDLHR